MIFLIIYIYTTIFPTIDVDYSQGYREENLRWVPTPGFTVNEPCFTSEMKLGHGIIVNIIIRGWWLIDKIMITRSSLKTHPISAFTGLTYKIFKLVSRKVNSKPSVRRAAKSPSCSPFH